MLNFALAAMEEKIETFYCCLLLMTAILPSRREHLEDLSPRRTWHRFLNEVCWFCDTHRGGQTVTGIAISGSERVPILWVASNGGKAKPKIHVDWLFQTLRKGEFSSESGRASLQAVILEHAVSISRQKVVNYMRRLENDLDKAANMTGTEKCELRCRCNGNICICLTNV